MPPHKSSPNADTEVSLPTLAGQTTHSTGAGTSSVIGPCHLLQSLGEGGMGEGWPSRKNRSGAASLSS